jgi:hypothetical protein
MNEIILDNITLRLDLISLIERLRMNEDDPDAEDLKQMVCDVRPISKPKALYKAAFIESRGTDCVLIDGVTFTSRVLGINLEKVHRVFPFIATCGTELEDWSNSMKDMLHRYWADTIKEMALESAVRELNRHMDERFRPGRMSVMSPGSLQDWPIEQQRALFALLGSPAETIGVRLSEDYLMLPIKSVSGMRFSSQESFESCQLCPREICPGRRAPYDEGLLEKRYRLGKD